MTDTDVQPGATRHSFRGKDLGWWCLSFIGFPIGGLVAEAIVGPIDEVWVCRGRRGDRRRCDRSGPMVLAPADRARCIDVRLVRAPRSERSLGSG